MIVKFFSSLILILSCFPSSVLADSYANIYFELLGLKSDSKSWDILKGAPDPVICVFSNNRSHKNKGYCFSSGIGMREARKSSVRIGALRTAINGAGICHNSYKCKFDRVPLGSENYEIYIYDQDPGLSDIVAVVKCRSDSCKLNENNRLRSFKLTLLSNKEEEVKEETRFVDRRLMSEQGKYQVHFCYRPSPHLFGFPGHTYVGFYSQENNTSPVSYRAFGATTRDIRKIFDADGYILPEYQSVMGQNCLIVKVDSNQFNKSWNIVSSVFSGKPEYSYWKYDILDSTCVTYARKVAKNLGLIINSNKLPRYFIKKLKHDNS